jgi:uncharacterized protein YqhQ
LSTEREGQPLRLGGMALRNGLLVHGPTSWAAAVRDEHGGVQVASGPKPRLRAGDTVPGVRGVVRLGEALALVPIVKRRLPAAQLPFQNPAVLGVAAACTMAGARARRMPAAGGLAGEAAAGLLSVLPALTALRSQELAAYHGAEHKTIAAYEQGEESAATQAKEHDRCGSHLLVPMLVANVLGAALVRRLIERPGRLAQGGVALASAGFAVEVFAWSERNADHRLALALRRPGHALQRLAGTREPTAEQLEVGEAALRALLDVEASSPRADARGTAGG